MTTPTHSQAQVLRMIATFQAKHGYSPTTREIANHCGYRSQNAAMNHLRALRAKGIVTWEAGKARTLRIL